MKPLILFGAGKIAEVLLYFFRNHSDREVVALTADEKYMTGDALYDLPLVSFENIDEEYPPESHDMFIALGYQELNALRATKLKEAKSKGYSLASYIHPKSGIPNDCLYGENCFVMNNVMIHPKVTLGDNVFVWSGAMIGHHSNIGDNCWLTSCANISGVVSVGQNCFFAVNATVGHGITIGKECFFGANSLVTKCTDDAQVFLAESTKPFRINSHQFLRMSDFTDL